MTKQRTGLELEFKNEIVQARSGQGSTHFGKSLKDIFRERGLTDAVMDEIIQEANMEAARKIA
jgi:hypothetical protein